MEPRELAFSHIQANGMRLHVAEAGPGNGPLVFLLHGFPESWYAWRGQIGALAAAGFRVVAPDQRGYGRSDKPRHASEYRLDVLAADILGLANAMARDRFCVVGHDWGASVGWWLATRYPQRMDRFVALNAPHPVVWHEAMRGDPEQRRKSWYVRFFRLPAIPEWLLARNDYAALAKGFEDCIRPGAFTADDLAIYRRGWSQPGALTGMLNWYRAILRDPPVPSGELRIAVPTHVIWGARDRYAGPRLAEASARLCADGRVTYMEHATHWVQHDDPGEVARLCVEFLRG